MFWKSYKTIIPAVLGIVPVVCQGFGIQISPAIAADMTGLAIFLVGLMAKDYNIK